VHPRFNLPYSFLQDGPPKYLSITTYERCKTELLRDFYMDNEYRMEWDNTVTKHEQLQCDENTGVEVGRTVKEFPLLTAREYILAWRVWEADDKSFYCFIKVTLTLLPVQPYIVLCITIRYIVSFHHTKFHLCNSNVLHVLMYNVHILNIV
jgi:hypothetical protein